MHILVICILLKAFAEQLWNSSGSIWERWQRVIDDVNGAWRAAISAGQVEYEHVAEHEQVDEYTHVVEHEHTVECKHARNILCIYIHIYIYICISII